MNSLVKKIIFALIGVNILLAAWFVLHNDIIFGFSGDIARDMYLMQETAIKKVLLIGAKSGAIPGQFHGPAWIYLNLPAFILTNGNPVGVGWFWVVLAIFSLISTYYIAQKLFDRNVALISTLLYSVFIIEPTKELTNPYGAVLIFPIFFYFLYLYCKHSRFKDFLISILLGGFMVQFQIAFGGPILLLTVLLMLYRLRETKKWSHLLGLAVLIIPFSTYILFDLRHDFLQLTSLYNYIFGAETFGKQPLHIIVKTRLYGFFIDGLYMFKSLPKMLSIALIAVFGYLFHKAKKPNKALPLYLLFAYLYGGYWIINSLYQGIVFEYYYWPFLPVVAMLFASSVTVINKKVFAIMFFTIYIFTFIRGYKATVVYANEYIGKDSGSWLFNRNLAEQVYDYNTEEFGYFIFTPDLHATGTKYAMYYMQKFKSNKGYLNTKKRTTYIVFSPPPEGQEYNNGDWWKTDMVTIKREPDSIETLLNGFRIEKYTLTDEELAVPTNPGLVNRFNLEH